MLKKNKRILPLVISIFCSMSAYANESILLASSGNNSQYDVESLKDASRFLAQASFGANIQEIKNLTNYQDYLTEQLSEPATYLYPKVDPNLTGRYNWISGGDINPASGQNKSFILGDLTNLWWHTFVNSKDQLRQRVALALSEIFVVGQVRDIGKQDHRRLHYYDLLIKNTFGNYRDLLTDITMSPVMASYLTMINNPKTDERKGYHPDENFAREIMQLFTIGLVKLNIDGTLQLDTDGNSIPTYTQADVEGLAKVFTGLTYSKEERFRNYEVIKKPEVYEGRFGTRAEHLLDVYSAPMMCLQSQHEPGEKNIVDGITIPSGQDCLDDIEMALDTLFNHETLPPFFAKQLIQKLVTSNPSPQYIERVASIFVDNGSGVRGDMTAIIKAILLDDEARAPAGTLANFGKIKEPLIRSSAFAKAFNVSADVEYPTRNAFPAAGQRFFRAPSVFNYFQPSYKVGKDLSQENLVAPELEIATAENITEANNAYTDLLYRANFLTTSSTNKNNENRYYINLSHELELAKQSTDELVEHLSLLLLEGNMSEQYRETLKTYIDSFVIKAGHNEEQRERIYQKRVFHAIYIVMSSSAQKYLH